MKCWKRWVATPTMLLLSVAAIADGRQVEAEHRELWVALLLENVIEG